MDDLTRQIAADWGPESPYYKLVETGWAIDLFWGETYPFLPLFKQLRLDNLVELACGHGRHTHQILSRYPSVGNVTLIDVNASNIDVCRDRFVNRPGITFIQNDGRSIPMPDGVASAIFSYDAMVHFEYDDVAAYLRETFRVLRPGGRALFHHSNNTSEPGRLYSECTHWRNFMSAPLFDHLASRAGLRTLKQSIIDWGEARDLDAITLLEKPAT